MADKRKYFFKEDDIKLKEAYEQAQSTFKYFWREISWEYRRIVPALEVSCVKAAFSESFEDSDETVVEHMWITDIEFDGDVIKGVLINTPNFLKNINNGDVVNIELHQVSDWLFSIAGETYGGFTIHAMKTEMSDEERDGYHDAWGLDLDNSSTVKIVHKQEEMPENIVEHPMSINMKESLIDFLTQNPNEMLSDKDGYNFLHRETIAGNLTLVKVLLNLGVDRNLRTKHGKTALDFAKQLNWEHIIPILES